MEYKKTSIEFEFVCRSESSSSCDCYESNGEGGCKHLEMQIGGNYCCSDDAIREEFFKIRENV